MKKSNLIFILVILGILIFTLLKPVRVFMYISLYELKDELGLYYAPSYKFIGQTEEEKRRTKFNVEEYVSEDNLVDSIKTKYFNSTLEDIGGIKASIFYFNNKYKIEYLKKDFYNNGDFRYVVYYMSKNKYLELFFDKDGEFSGSHIVKFSKKKSFFEKLKVGDTDIFDVMIEDKNGEYGYFHIPSGPGISNRYSTHYTNDGYLVKIEYDDDWKIKEINIEPI